MSMSLFGFIFSPQDLLLLAVLGVLLFGRKLPDLARSVGKSMTEFKKGMKGIEDEVSEPTGARAAIEPEPVKAPARVTPSTSAPKFDDAPAPSNAPPKL